MPANLENSAIATGLEKVSFHSNAKECSNYHTTELISHASKAMLKILQIRHQQYVNWELPDVQAGFRKGRGSRDQIANIHWIIEQAREFQKNAFCFIDYTKVFDCVDLNKLLKILKVMGILDHFTCLLPKRSMHDKKQQLEPDMEQQTGSKLGKEYIKAIYCKPAHLTYILCMSLLHPAQHFANCTLHIS